MTDSIPRDSLKAFQLKECYELAAQFEPLSPAKDILREKSKKLDVSMSYAPVQTDAPLPQTEMQIVSEALYALSLEGFASFESGSFPMGYKINSLPESAEKEFVLALISLRLGTRESYRLNALQHLSAALGFSPDDPRLHAFFDILQEAGKK